MRGERVIHADGARPLPNPSSPGVLVAVLSNPPLTTGQRTRARVEVAREALGFDFVSITNLVGVPTATTPQLATAAAHPAPWLCARLILAQHLDGASGVLFAFGVRPPPGPTRRLVLDQVAWLEDAARARDLAIWSVSSSPRHPSRWQRWTSRQHPGVPFAAALQQELQPYLAQRDAS